MKKGKKKPHFTKNSGGKKRNFKNKSKTLEGIVRTTPKGVGFVEQGDPKKDDIRIEAGKLNTAMHGDRVSCEILPRKFKGQQTGKIVKVIHRAKKRFVGTLLKTEDGIVVRPDDKKSYFSILPKDHSKATLNDKVLVEIFPWNNPNKLPEGKIIERIGRKGEHEAEIRSIILEKGIDDNFPAPVEKEAEQIFKNYKTESNIAGRKDFRKITTFTIDPVDAKDFDDAISVNFLKNGDVEIGVHIADVSHFVVPGSALDTEAKERAFSAYLVDRTIPMLPEVLSNDLCSLKPEVDRLTYSAWFTLSKNGDVKSREFGKGIIHSDKRFTYEEAQEVLNKKGGEYFDELTFLNETAKKWRAQRTERGSIDFEQHEVRFELADDGVPLSVFHKERLDTHKLIEEFMLLANREIAEFGQKFFKGGPFIYRVHDTPNPDRIRDLAEFVKACGHTLKIDNKGSVSGKDLNKLFDEVDGTPEEDIIATAGIRSMSKAIYTTKNIGHFGLALGAYTHFTSPIRRYADLLVHRLVEYYKQNGNAPKSQAAWYERTAQSISERELSVIDAERESVKLKQAEYMSERIGQEFDGVISGVNEWGIFVEELGTHAEGLIRLANIPNDYYRYEQKKYRIVGEKTKKTFSLSDKVRIKIVSVDLDRKQIECALVE